MAKFNLVPSVQSDKKRADTVEAWLLKYYNFLSIAVVPLAYMAYELPEWLKIIGENSPLSRDQATDWERCFRQPPNWRNFGVSLYENFNKHSRLHKKRLNPAQLFNFDFAQAFNHSTNLYGKVMKKIRLSVRKMLGLFIRQKTDLEMNIEAVVLLIAEFRQSEKRPPRWLEKKMRTPEFLFLFEIELPCWIYFQETVNELLDKIKIDPQKNFRSLQKLMQLDRGFINHPIVGRTYRDLQSDKLCSKLLHRTIETGMQYGQFGANDGETQKTKVREIKYLIIALIMELCRQFEQMLDQLERDAAVETKRLKTTTRHNDDRKILDQQLREVKQFCARFKGEPLNLVAIHNLFDIIARDKNPALPRDTDMPALEKSFANAINRYKKYWSRIKFFPEIPSQKVV